MRPLLIVALALSVAACSGGGEGEGQRGGDESTSTSAAGGAEVASQDASEVADALDGEVPTVDKIVEITEDNDANNLLGRPNGYESAAVIYDEAASCDMPGVDCGAVVESFGDEAAATARAEYIQTVLKEAPGLGSEWTYTKGSVLLRVSGQLKPSAASEYEAAFDGEEVTAPAE